MKKRILYAKNNGCDFVEFDNMDWADSENIKNYNLAITEKEAREYSHNLCKYTHSLGLKCMAKSTTFGDKIFDGMTAESFASDKN